MDYDISWTHSDPVYHRYIRNIGVLVSPPNVSHAWSVDEWTDLPPSLIIDSGAYQYHREGRVVEPRAVLDDNSSRSPPPTCLLAFVTSTSPDPGTRHTRYRAPRVAEPPERPLAYDVCA